MVLQMDAQNVNEFKHKKIQNIFFSNSNISWKIWGFYLLTEFVSK